MPQPKKPTLEEQILKDIEFCQRWMNDCEAKIKKAQGIDKLNLRDVIDYHYFKGARDGKGEILKMLNGWELK